MRSGSRCLYHIIQNLMLYINPEPKHAKNLNLMLKLLVTPSTRPKFWCSFYQIQRVVTFCKFEQTLIPFVFKASIYILKYSSLSSTLVSSKKSSRPQSGDHTMLFSWKSPPLRAESSLQTTPHRPKRLLDPDHSFTSTTE